MVICDWTYNKFKLDCWRTKDYVAVDFEATDSVEDLEKKINSCHGFTKTL